MASIPEKLLARKHEINAQFLTLLDQHIDEILEGKINYSFKPKDFAEMMSINPAYLRNVVLLVTKRSPRDFIYERLTAEAEKMLSESTLSVTEISDKLLFESTDSFAKFFNRQTGMTPLAYRKQVKQHDELIAK